MQEISNFGNQSNNNIVKIATLKEEIAKLEQEVSDYKKIVEKIDNAITLIAKSKKDIDELKEELRKSYQSPKDDLKKYIDEMQELSTKKLEESLESLNEKINIINKQIEEKKEELKKLGGGYITGTLSGSLIGTAGSSTPSQSGISGSSSGWGNLDTKWNNNLISEESSSENTTIIGATGSGTAAGKSVIGNEGNNEDKNGIGGQGGNQTPTQLGSGTGTGDKKISLAEAREAKNRAEQEYRFNHNPSTLKNMLNAEEQYNATLKEERDNALKNYIDHHDPNALQQYQSFANELDSLEKRSASNVVKVSKNTTEKTYEDKEIIMLNSIGKTYNELKNARERIKVSHTAEDIENWKRLEESYKKQVQAWNETQALRNGKSGKYIVSNTSSTSKGSTTPKTSTQPVKTPTKPSTSTPKAKTVDNRFDTKF